MSDNEKKPTVNDLCKWIENNEGNVWDEYISVWNYPPQDKTILEDILYDEGRLICVPHYGGNEGAYLDIYHQKMDDKKQIVINHLLTCKTLDSSPAKMIRCFESAGRIYNHICEVA